MSRKDCVQWPAALGIFLLGISLANPADYVGDGSSSSSEPKPAIVDWRSVESGDYQTYVKNLQAMGCPSQTIRSIVTTDVVAAFAGKRAEAVAARYQNFKYWKADPAETEARAKLAGQRRAINEEMNGVLQQLLGTDTDLPDVSREWKQEEWNQELAFLAPDKLEATKVILLEYAKVDEQMKELAGGMNLTEDTNELQRIQGRSEEKNTALNQVLTPEEFKQVEMTTSWTAENLRHALVHFSPTKGEFRIIFEAWQPHDENLSRIHAARQHDPGNKEKEVYAKIKEQLSAPRYEQYCTTWWK
jgi:hypothetical protein